jgi:hypothetical protein
VATFFRFHCGHLFASSVLMDPISKKFVGDMEQFAKDHDIPVVQFRKRTKRRHRRRTLEDVRGGRRRAVNRQGSGEDSGIPDRAAVQRENWRELSVAGAVHGHGQPLYMYCVDGDFGPFFLKFCMYFPYNAKLCLNSHEYLKRLLRRKGIGFESLDNGLLSCQDPKRAQAICDGLSPDKIDALLRKWSANCPIRLQPRTGKPDTAITSRSCKPNSLSPRYWIV